MSQRNLGHQTTLRFQIGPALAMLSGRRGLQPPRSGQMLAVARQPKVNLVAWLRSLTNCRICSVLATITTILSATLLDAHTPVPGACFHEVALTDLEVLIHAGRYHPYKEPPWGLYTPCVTSIKLVSLIPRQFSRSLAQVSQHQAPSSRRSLLALSTHLVA